MKYILSAICGAFIVYVIDMLILNCRLDKAYKLGLVHAKDLYNKFPNNFIEAIDYMIDKQEVEE